MTTTSPSFTKEIAFDRLTKDYTATVDGQLIGSFSTHHEAEVAADEHVFNLLSDGMHIPASTLDGVCGDCGAALDSMGLCGCGAEKTIKAGDTVTLSNPDEYHLAGTVIATPGFIEDCSPEPVPYFSVTFDCADGTRENLWLVAEEITTDHTRPAPLSCICGQPAPILEPHGAFCGACLEAANLWRLWKTDSTAFVAELRRQNCRLHEMATRLATYLNAKNKSSLGTDSILAMWRQLLDDGDPEPRFYVVAARQQVAA